MFRDRLGLGGRQRGWVGAGESQLLLNWSLDEGQKEPVTDEGGEAR